MFFWNSLALSMIHGAMMKIKIQNISITPKSLLVDFVLILTFKIQNISITPCFSNNQYTRHLCSVTIALLAVEFHMDGSYTVICRFFYFKTQNPCCQMYQQMFLFYC
ncbi:unnamed protein product [Rangifer tarandus platyrhynchus]|uniref:Uncharacterized protein n=1 Tax=Rangifer tarandus platyrhynchus TaxID=3082113 RepID=A0AC59ZP63_RANTA